MATIVTTDTVNKDCKITNDSGTDILVLDARATGSGDLSKQQIYEQQLTTLPTSVGTLVIAAGTTQTVTLNDSHVRKDIDGKVVKDGQGNPVIVYDDMYELIYAKPSTLFPVHIAVEALPDDFDAPQVYPAVDVTAEDYSNMKLAEQFHQTISAFPSSDLAKGFQEAITGTDTSASIEKSEQAVIAYFTGTSQYKSLTLPMVLAISTYYNQYPFIWAGYQPTKRYYLYTSDGKTNSCVGTVDLADQCARPLSADKKLLGFIITYKDSSGKGNTPLHYLKGQMVDDSTSGVPGICLQGMFVIKRQLTKKPDDKNIITILMGTVNGDNVIGYDQKIDGSGDSDADKWGGLYPLLHPTNFMGYITLFMTATGVIMGLEMAAKMLKGTYDYAKSGYSYVKDKGKSFSDWWNDRQPEIAANKEAALEETQSRMNNLNKEIKIGDSETLGSEMENLKQMKELQLLKDERSRLIESMEEQYDMLCDAAEVTNMDNFSDIASDIRSAADDLNNAKTLEDLKSQIATAKNQVSQFETETNSLIKTVDESFKTQLAEQMNQVEADLKVADDDLESINDDVETNASGDIEEGINILEEAEA